MRQIVDVRELNVGNIVLLAGYDQENNQDNNPAGWVFHTAVVTKVDTGRNKSGLMPQLDSPAIELHYLTPAFQAYGLTLYTTGFGRHVSDSNSEEWFVALLQTHGELQTPVDDDSDDQPWPHRVNPCTPLTKTWGADISRY